MEWVAHLAGESHTDHPACVSPMLIEFCIGLNDALPDDQRQRLRPYLTRTIGTVDDGLDDARRWMCADWVVREYTPAWLEVVPSLAADAAALRSLPPVLDVDDVVSATDTLRPARERATAVWYATWDASWDNAWGAANSAARDAARDAGRDAFRVVVSAGAWVPAWGAVTDTATAAARATAWLAAKHAAWGATCDGVSDAVRPAARNALAAATRKLQDSVLDAGGLLDRMLPTEEIEIPSAAETWAIYLGALA